MNTTRTYVGARMLIATVVAAALSVPISAVPAEGETLTQHTWAWGANSAGQLGDGRTTNRSYAGAVPGMADVVHVAAGVSHSLALDSTGKIWAWGSNTFGQLGDGTTTSRSAPATVTGLSGAVALAAGEQHSLALHRDGTVWAWGYNRDRRLGEGTAVDRHEPVRVTGLDRVVAVASRGRESFAVREDGTVWAWGYIVWSVPEPGEPNPYLPSVMPGLSDVVDVAAGANHALALRSDGTVQAWGRNSCGQVGDGTTQDRGPPVAIPGLSDVAAIGAGAEHSVALREDGTVWTWGCNTHGQLGDGSTIDRPSPSPVTGLSDVQSVSAGAHHSLALDATGLAWAWGRNAEGQLGDRTIHDRSVPAAVAGLGGFGSIAAGGSHSMALRSGPPATPGSPTGVAATVGDTTAQVRWTAPPDGGSPITSYTLLAVPDGTTLTVPAGSTSAEFTGLSNGTRYRFAVRASNALGSSAWSAPSTPDVYAIAPGAPADVNAAVPCPVCAPAWSSDGGSATVTWAPPAADGGSDITGYRITRHPGNVTTSVGNVRSWVIKGLDYGASHTFTVTAVNAVGEGPASNPSPAVTPQSAPARPTQIVARAFDGSAKVSWSAPPDGGSPITRYDVMVSPGGHTVSVSGAETSAMISQLPNGTPHVFTVRAVNQVGESPWSAQSNWVTPASPTPPGTVADLTRTVAFDRLTATSPRPRVVLTWTNLGTADAIKVQWTEGSRTRSATLPADATRYTVTDLALGRRYWFTVRAINNGTLSAASTVSAHGSAVDAVAKTSSSTSVVKGQLTRAGTDTALGGRWVQLQTRARRADGSYSRWSNATSAVRTTSTGTYRIRHRIPAGTQYRVVFAGARADLGTISRVSTLR